ncbi:DUF4189 domain-containing protein [Breoghania sp. L-A4]|nr:DUF4189 domain-containing protein [Breoghania sp. L-A4]
MPKLFCIVHIKCIFMKTNYRCVMIFRFSFLFLAAMVFCFSEAKTTSASELSRSVCAKRVNDKSIRIGYHAFAYSADREHCGWAWNKDSIRHAQARAMRGCKKFKGADCKIVHSGCEPSGRTSCGK